jgi:hypothetical protein
VNSTYDAATTRHACDRCGAVSQLAEVYLFWGVGVQVECRDRAACSERAITRGDEGGAVMNSEPPICGACEGKGVLRVGDDHEYETFECGPCRGTGLAGRSAGYIDRTPDWYYAEDGAIPD